MTTIPEELVLRIAKLLAPESMKIELIDPIPSDCNAKDKDSYVPGVALAAILSGLSDFPPFQQRLY